LHLTIHRGTHEIGGTFIEVRTAGSRILLDAGYPLFLNGSPIDDTVAALPVGELLALGVLPKIEGLYRWDAPAFDAVVLSHAHIDHYGLLKYVNERILVHMSAGTAKLLEISQLFRICAAVPSNVRIFRMYEAFHVDDIRIKPYLMDHSAFDAAAFEISSRDKTIIYTGDFRGHGRKAVCLSRFAQNAARQADALLIEGTMFGRQDEEILTEDALEDAAAGMMKGRRGPVLFQASSQNIDRLVSFYRASLRVGRRLVVDAYTANVLYELRQLGNSLPYPSEKYPDIKVFYPYRLTQKIFNEIGARYAKRFSAFHMPKETLRDQQDSIVMAVRPSMLRDIEKCGLRNGLYLYSMWSGYRESEPQQRLERFLQGAGFECKQLHTSGHASVADIEMIVRALDPRMLIPIHTMTPDAFRGIAHNTKVQSDGVEFTL